MARSARRPCRPTQAPAGSRRSSALCACSPPNHFFAASRPQRCPERRLALLDKPLNALHNPVTLHVVCQHNAASQRIWRPGALLERACLTRRLAGTGAECGFPAAELLSTVSLVVAGRDQGGVS